MQNMTNKLPRVSIGMPVYNGESSIHKALDSLLAQSFTDFELIISDNASTDGTEAICREYAASDQRIRYIRQSENHRVLFNFQFVLNEAVGEYFMWAAADDAWGNEFIAENANFLNNNCDYVGSMSNAQVDGECPPEQIWLYILSLDDKKVRVRETAFRHGCNFVFYALFRTCTLRQFRVPDYSFVAGDWALILDILKHGKINVLSNNIQFVKTNGMGSTVRKFDVFRRHSIEYLLPFFWYTRKVIHEAVSARILWKSVHYNIYSAFWYWGHKLKILSAKMNRYLR